MKKEKMKKKILFICTHNSARSQIAEGLVKSLCGELFDAYSAGTDPTEVNPYAVKVMEEIGIDISKQYSKKVDKFTGTKFDYVVTVCSGADKICPFFPGEKEYIHKSFEDPSSFKGAEDEIIEKFRNVRDEIKYWIKEKFGELN
jgi:arsenate reductase